MSDSLSLILMPSLACNFRCGHCYTGNPPRQLCGRMTAREMTDYVKAAAAYGANSLCISGGEPFLLLGELEEPIFTAEQLGMDVILRTNGFWAATKDRTRRVLKRLKWLGVTQLGLSYDRYHAPFIHLANIQRVVDACQELDLPLWLDWCGKERSREIYRILGRKTFLKLSNWHSAPIAKLGHATYLPDDAFDLYPVDSFEYECPASIQCSNGDASELYIYPNRFAILQECCWIHPRLLQRIPRDRHWVGKLKELRGRDSAVRLLVNEGVGGLIRLAREKAPLSLKPYYSSPCEICIELLGRLFPKNGITERDFVE